MEILAGDASQFRHIVDAYRQPLLRVAFRFTGNWQDAEELAQTTFIRVYRSLYQYKQALPFEPWLFRIHLNNCKSFHRKRQWERLFRIPFGDVTATSASEVRDPTIEQRIAEAVAMLPWRQKAAFSLIELEENSIAEAAQLMGCAEATVRVHLHRAKQTLRKQLGGLFDE